MFRHINSMWMVSRSMTRGKYFHGTGNYGDGFLDPTGAQRHLSLGTLRWNESSSQKDPQPEEETVPAKEASAIAVAVKSEEACSTEKNQSQQLDNGYKMNRREAFRRMMREKSNIDCNEQKTFEQKNSSDYGQSPLWRQSVPWVPQPVYRGPKVKQIKEKKDEPKETVKPNRRYYLRQMCMERLQQPQNRKTSDNVQKQSITKIKRESLDPARVELLNLRWKEQQQEIAKRMKEADKKKFVSRFEQNAGRREKI